MSDNKHSRLFRGRGYYIALILCAAAIGITSYVYNTGREPEAVQTVNTPASITGQVSLPTRDTTPPESTGQVSLPTRDTTPPESTEAQTPTAGKLAACMPVEGQVLTPYAMEVLSYNQTTRDWRTHNGIDLAAEAGAEVHAAADGEVYSVTREDSLGHTVVIRHDDGYTTGYSCLAEEIPVQPGDKVVMGDTIGYAGESAVTEATLGSHVHFSVSRYQEPMDPAEFLALGQ